ncbi:cilia- and flagella-associated protein 161 [Brachyhypopomus gauderio]|uniref:cilia- and flagella-associated protein 161 n=1 Tax=Brachyhypopomus gauderio TaxID=698409 RepID=UPI004042903A
MANVRKYSPNVRVGNWREDEALGQDTLKDFLHRKDKGELTIQKTGTLRQNILKPVSLTVSQDGFLHFGDTVMLVNPGGTKADPRNPCTVSIIADLSSVRSHPQANFEPYLQGPCQVGGASSLKPCVRNAFVITSVDGTPNGDMLRYEQNFALRTTAGFAGELFLASDHRTLEKCAKRSRLQEVSLVEQLEFFCWWRVVYFDPQERLEYEGYPVQGNTKVLISHCKTNQCLAALANYILWTPFGKEYEITAHTLRDSHKAERDSNHWLFVPADPGEHVGPITQENQPDPQPVTDT